LPSADKGSDHSQPGHKSEDTGRMPVRPNGLPNTVTPLDHIELGD
jgi:hypothetical protein